MESIRLTVLPKLRSHILRFSVVFIGLFYSIKALSSIPKNGFWVYQFWIPESLWLKKALLPLLKYNIGHSVIENIIYSIILLLIGYALYYVALTKTESFTLTNRYIEYNHGILTRTHDTVDLLIVKDQEMKQNLLEMIIGIAKLKVTSSDVTHPELIIWGLSKKDALATLEHLRVHTIRNYTDYRINQDIKKKSKNQTKQIDEDV